MPNGEFLPTVGLKAFLRMDKDGVLERGAALELLIFDHIFNEQKNYGYNTIQAVNLFFDDYFCLAQFVREKLPDKTDHVYVFDHIDLNTSHGSIKVYPQIQFTMSWIYVWERLVKEVSKPNGNRVSANVNLVKITD